MLRIFLFIFLVPSLAIGQNNPEVIYYKDRYATKKVKSGRYMLTTTNVNDSITTRIFTNTKNGQKIWTESYLGKQPYGTWERYDKFGNLISQTDYNFILEYGKYATPEMLAELEEKPIEITPSKNNQEIIQNHIKKTFRYPQLAQMKDVQGRVVVMFWINKMGEVGNVRILEGSHILLDTEAYRIAKSLPDLEPVLNDGEKIDAQCRIPITFHLH